jgi:IstB-like ATP binding protein
MLFVREILSRHPGAKIIYDIKCTCNLAKWVHEHGGEPHGSGGYAKLLAQWAKTDILVMDDLAMAPLTDSARRDLLEVLDDRHGLRSTIITSQIPVDNWHAAIDDPTLADAILDRLVHNAHRLTLSGALHQLRPARSAQTTLITGVKRELGLLSRIPSPGMDTAGNRASKRPWPHGEHTG